MLKSDLNIWSAVTIFLLTMGCTAFAGRIIYVDGSAIGANDGLSWADAYNFLQDALADANSAEKPVEIRVAQGIYTPDSSSADPNGTGDRQATFQLINGVIIKGGYAGFGQPDANARDFTIHETILSGDIGTVDHNTDNSYHVVTGSGTDETAVLDGFTITGGRGHVGGGMYNYNGSPTLMNCTFRANVAREGGGMYNEQGNPTITDCTFSDNEAIFAGGMCNDQSSPTLTNCTFTGNSAQQGGGMRNVVESEPMLINCTFSSNHASSRGGGIYNQFFGSPTLINCRIIGNMAGVVRASYGNGGGMYNRDGCNPILINCIIAGNSAKGDSRTGRGGGIYNRNLKLDSSLTLTNCTFVDNSAPRGNALACDSLYPGFPTTIRATNCILWDGGSEIWNNDNSTITISYSCVQGLVAGRFGLPGGNINRDPYFAQPGYWDANGVWVDGDYHLLPDSPCIDAGDPNGNYDGQVDIDGDPRVMCRVDMGADEADCFPKDFSTYSDWVAMGKPDCWCYCWPYQCDGDADGVSSGQSFNYRLYAGDLELIVENWKKKIDDPTLNPCADIDHKAEGLESYRVFMNDLAILLANWKKEDAQLPGDCPRPE